MQNRNQNKTGRSTSPGETARRVLLVAGASSGIGMACARLLGQNGWRVYAAARGMEGKSGPFTGLVMDVRSSTSVAKGIEEIVSIHGRLDAVVYCAGYGLAGAVEDTDPEEALDLLDTHVMGALRVCRNAIPVMRRRGAGRLVFIGSLAARVPLPFQGFYSAAKAALEAVVRALEMETEGFNISVTLVEPGDMKTDFTKNRKLAEQALSNPAYSALLKKAVGVMEKDEQTGPPPLVAARLVRRILGAGRPGFRYTAGRVSQRFLAKIAPFLPDRLAHGLIARYYRIR